MVSWGQNGITNVKHWTQCLARRECSVGGERSIPAEPVWAEAQSWECVHAELIRREESGVYRGLSQPRRQGFGDTEEALTVGPFLLLSPQLSSSAVTRRSCPPRYFCPCICLLVPSGAYAHSVKTGACLLTESSKMEGESWNSYHWWPRLFWEMESSLKFYCFSFLFLPHPLYLLPSVTHKLLKSEEQTAVNVAIAEPQTQCKMDWFLMMWRNAYIIKWKGRIRCGEVRT